MRIALLGFGLIGGSIARALRAVPAAGSGSGGPWSVVAWSPSGAGPRAAEQAGDIERAAATAPEAVAGAALVVLAGPPPACLGLLDRLADTWRDALAPGAVITDVASTKGAIVARAADLGLRFVGGHPMAGRETSGYVASTADLFLDRPWVIVPGDDAEAVGIVERLVTATDARPLHMSAADHDRAVAGVSHLPLLVSAALVEAVAGTGGRALAARGTPDDPGDWAMASRLAASGWRDMTRLARGDVEMGSGIAVTNGPAIAARLRDLIAVLETWLRELERDEGPDAAAIADRLRTARDRLEAMPR
jgi:prephenate dehydrogenase